MTASPHCCSMPRAPEPRGVCIIRASREPTGLVLHIVTRVDIFDTAGEVEEIEVEV